MGRDRRRHTRYCLEGQAVFRTVKAMEGSGEPVNVAVEGLLLRSDVVPGEGTELWVHFTMPGQAEKFIAAGRVVHSHQDMFGVVFLEAPAGLGSFLGSLSQLSD